MTSLLAGGRDRSKAGGGRLSHVQETPGRPRRGAGSGRGAGGRGQGLGVQQTLRMEGRRTRSTSGSGRRRPTPGGGRGASAKRFDPGGRADGPGRGGLGTGWEVRGTSPGRRQGFVLKKLVPSPEIGTWGAADWGGNRALRAGRAKVACPRRVDRVREPGDESELGEGGGSWVKGVGGVQWRPQEQCQ